MKRSNDGIQFVAHAELDGEDAFAAACELGLEGNVSKLDGSLQVGTVQKLDQGPQPGVAAYCFARQPNRHNAPIPKTKKKMMAAEEQGRQ